MPAKPLISLAGVEKLPQANDINGCDSPEAEKTPAKSPVNPAECRTLHWRRLKFALAIFQSGSSSDKGLSSPQEARS
jgi:hypothetical protein